MTAIPQSTKDSLELRLLDLVRAQWPGFQTVTLKFRGRFAYITGVTLDGEELPLCRLRCIGYASEWGFAIYRVSHDDYQDTYFPDGSDTGTPEEAVSTACRLPHRVELGIWFSTPLAAHVGSRVRTVLRSNTSAHGASRSSSVESSSSSVAVQPFNRVTGASP